MKLIVLGSGTCVPSLKRNAPGYFLEAADCQVIVDCGSGSLLQLEKAGRSYRTIDAVFITHKHPDHFSDLLPLIHALVATPQFRRERPLNIFAPPGFAAYYETAVAPVMGKQERLTIHITEVGDKFDFGPFHVFTAKTLHSHDSIAYRFEQDGKSIVFTGDADYDQAIIDIAENADLLVADCSFPHDAKAKGHLTARECGMVAQRAGVKEVVLSHLYPSERSDDERLSECRATFHGKARLAEDLMEICL